MTAPQHLLEECQRYLHLAEEAYCKGSTEKAVGYAALAVERYHDLIPLSPPELVEPRLYQVDQILDFIKTAEDTSGKARQLERGSQDGTAETRNPWLVREVPHVSEDDVIGMDELKRELQLFIDKIQHPEIVARWKHARKGNRMILWGPPGTGKTFFAKYVASRIDAAFYQVKASNLLSKWVGESQQNVVRLFESVEKDDRAVVFMDEIDSVLARRGSNSTVRDGVVTEFLQCMDGLATTDRALFFIGATNRPFDLDEAAISRFGMMVYVPLPDYQMRLVYNKKLLANLPEGHDETICAEELAKHFEGHSMRDLKRFEENLSDLGIQKAVRRESARITPADVQLATSRIAPPLSPQEMRRFENLVRNLRQE